MPHSAGRATPPRCSPGPHITSGSSLPWRTVGWRRRSSIPRRAVTPVRYCLAIGCAACDRNRETVFRQRKVERMHHQLQSRRRDGFAMSLILLPAVDVVDGRAVRLVQGKAGSETEYGSALDAALSWQRDGAEWIHLVDLDAAFGRGSNRELLAEAIGRLDVAVELSGGIRDDESLTAALATGCARVNLGTAALENPHW